MNTRAIATEYRQAQWRKILRERRESGLSIKAYCEINGIHENTYYYWQKKLRETLCEEIERAREETGRKREIAPSGWAVCEMQTMLPSRTQEPAITESPSQSQNMVRIQIGKNIIEIASAGKETVTAIIEAMMGKPSLAETRRTC